MDRKDRRHESAPPQEAGHLKQDQKKQNRRRRVEQHIRQVMSGRIQPVKLAIQHMRKPGERMPIGRMQMGKGPDDASSRQTARDVRILKDVIAVIKIDELMMNRLAEDHPGDCGQKKADPEDHPAVVPASAFPRDDLGLRFCLHSISRRPRSCEGDGSGANSLHWMSPGANSTPRVNQCTRKAPAAALQRLSAAASPAERDEADPLWRWPNARH